MREPQHPATPPASQPPQPPPAQPPDSDTSAETKFDLDLAERPEAEADQSAMGTDSSDLDAEAAM